MPIEVDETEIRQKIKELAKNAILPSEEIEGDNVWEHRWFCRGGISSLMWVLGEDPENTKHEIEYLDERARASEFCLIDEEEEETEE